MAKIINERQVDTTLTLESTNMENPPQLTKQPAVLLNLAKHPKTNITPSTSLEEIDIFTGVPKL